MGDHVYYIKNKPEILIKQKKRRRLLTGEKKEESLRKGREYAKEYYKNPINKARNANHAKNRRLKEKYRCIEYYSRGTMKCSCCGESVYEFLTLDHVNNDGAEHRRIANRDTIYGWLIANGFPEGFDVNCMNCNWGRRLTGVCPHKVIHNS